MKKQILIFVMFGIFLISLVYALTINSPEDGSFQITNPSILNATSNLTNSNLVFYLSNDTNFDVNDTVCNYTSVGLETKTCEVMSTYASNIPYENLVLWIDFDNVTCGGATIPDKSGLGNDIVSTNTMGTADNQGLLLDGCDYDNGDQYNSVTHNSSLNFQEHGFTISTWSYWQGNSASPRIITSSAWKGSSACYNSFTTPSWDFGHTIGDGCTVNVCANNGSVTTANTPIKIRTVECPIDNPNSWYHYVIDFNRDDGKIKLYVNGEYQGSVDISHIPGSYDNSGPLRFDRLYGWYHDAIVDEYMVFNKSLSAQEIENLYHSFDNYYYWKVNDTNGTYSYESNTYKFGIDLTNPELNKFSPIGVQDNYVLINYSSSDFFNHSLNITIDGTLNRSINQNATNQDLAYTVDLSVGEHNVSVEACDLSGRCSINEKIFDVSYIDEISIFSTDNELEISYKALDNELELLKLLWGLFT